MDFHPTFLTVVTYIPFLTRLLALEHFSWYPDVSDCYIYLVISLSLCASRTCISLFFWILAHLASSESDFNHQSKILSVFYVSNMDENCMRPQHGS